jgi:hypothetical protein
METSASRENLQNVLLTLAGEAAVPAGFSGLQKATPDDLVFVPLGIDFHSTDAASIGAKVDPPADGTLRIIVREDTFEDFDDDDDRSRMVSLQSRLPDEPW